MQQIRTNCRLLMQQIIELTPQDPSLVNSQATTSQLTSIVVSTRGFDVDCELSAVDKWL